MYQKLIDLLSRSLRRIEADRDVLALTSTPYTIAVVGDSSAIRYFPSGFNFRGTWEDCSQFDSITADKVRAKVQQQMPHLKLETVTIVALRERTHALHTELLQSVTPLAS